MATNRFVRPAIVAALSSLPLLAACDHSGIQHTDTKTAAATTTTSTVATNAGGRPKITYEPCTQIPASVIAQQKLDRRPPKPDRSSDGDIENNRCGYMAQARYGVTVTASNYTLEMDRKIDYHWDFKEFSIGGRRALSYYVMKDKSDSCTIDVEATTGTYGVMVTSPKNTFGEYPDCPTAARAHLDAFLPYFPA